MFSTPHETQYIKHPPSHPFWLRLVYTVHRDAFRAYMHENYDKQVDIVHGLNNFILWLHIVHDLYMKGKGLISSVNSWLNPQLTQTSPCPSYNFLFFLLALAALSFPEKLLCERDERDIPILVVFRYIPRKCSYIQPWADALPV